MVEERDIEGTQKVFVLSGSKELLQKLHWEMENLSGARSKETTIRAYHTFNCAVTAWHVVDWIFNTVEQKTLSKFGNGIGVKLESLSDLQKFFRENHRAMRICQQIANGSKHRVLTKWNDEEIVAYTSAGPKTTAQFGPAFKVMVSSEKLEIEAVFEEAYSILSDFIARLEI